MNWTGGALPRSRNGYAKATLTNTQKKHFAKVRGKQSGVLRSSPEFDTSIFKDAALRNHARDRERSRQVQRKDHHSQTKLANYENMAPTVRRLESLKPRQILRPLGEGPLGHQNTLAARAPEAHTSQPQQVGYEHHPAPSNPNRSSNYSPVPLSRMRDEVEPAGDFEVTREELLRRSDWVGLAKRTAPKIKFSTASDRNLIGKRRRLANAEHGPLQIQANKRRRIDEMLEDIRPQHPYRPPSSSLEGVTLESDRSGPADYAHLQSAAGKRKYQRGSGTPDEMLFDREVSTQASTDSQQKLSGSRFSQADAGQSLRAVHHRWTDGRATPASLQTSWAGFSPWNESEIITPRSNPDSREIKTASPLKHIKDRVALATRTPRLENSPWASVPGLPLIFESKSDLPIEISSAAEGEATCEHSSTGPELPTLHVHDRQASRSFTADKKNTLLEQRSIASHEIPSGRNLLLNQAMAHKLNLVQHTSPTEDIRSLGSSSHEQPYMVEDDATCKHRTQNSWPPLATTKPATDQIHEIKEAPPPPPTPGPELTSKQVPIPPAPPKPKTPTHEDEELIWRKFVFGSSDPHEDWTIDEPENPFKSQSSRLFDTSSAFTEPYQPSSNQSSVLAHASSSWEPTSTHAYDTSSPDQLSTLAQPSIAPVAPPFHTSSSSSTQNRRPLPSNNEAGAPKSRSKSSLQVQASASTPAAAPSPPRNGITFPSFSPDELASTPARPTI
ncbi:MAG: hypothetical protein Q9191_007321, partial [Dirinaria sp. TL-2023a]